MASAGEELSADEIALYDRQLRLWGIEAQNRMRKAKVLLITVKALGNEVAKNLVLAGIGSLTIVDPGDVTEKDVSSQFFVTQEERGKNVQLHLILADCVDSVPRHLQKRFDV
jgi:ubiquitin-like 1-activating enzyme E1 A